MYIQDVGAGDFSDDKGRNEKILKLMEDESNRRVYLTSRFSLCNEDGELFKTVVKNPFYLAHEIHGEHGFGYDPILIPDPRNLIENIRGKTTKISEERLAEIIFAGSIGRSQLQI